MRKKIMILNLGAGNPNLVRQAYDRDNYTLMIDHEAIANFDIASISKNQLLNDLIYQVANRDNETSSNMLDVEYHHVDRSYGDNFRFEPRLSNMNHLIASIDMFHSRDIFEFMEKSIQLYDAVTMYRVLEHISFTTVPYFLYLVSTVLKPNGVVEIIVPDYKKLAEMLLNENVYGETFESENILLTTEMLNEPNDPHGSIWTADRLEYFLTLERRFEIIKIETDFRLENRNIYLYCLARRTY